MNNASRNPVFCSPFYDEDGNEILPPPPAFGALFSDFTTPNDVTRVDYPRALRTSDFLFNLPHVDACPNPNEGRPQERDAKEHETVTHHEHVYERVARSSAYLPSHGTGGETRATAPVFTTWTLNNVEHKDLTEVTDHTDNHGQAAAGAVVQQTVISPGPASTAGRGPYSCFKCLKDYVLSSYLWKHQRKYVPEDQRPYPCGTPGCMKRFWFPKDVLRHDVKKHGGDGKTCPISTCDIQSNTHLDACNHISAAHRDPSSPPDVEIVHTYLSTLSATSTFNSSEGSSIFSIPPTPQTPKTILSSVPSYRSYGISPTSFLDATPKETYISFHS